MSVSGTQERAFTGLYSIARKSGLLEARAGQWFFSKAYFFYKRHIEDPYNALARRHPELFQGGHILDIGANIGYTSSVFARSIEAAYKVFAFEPEEFNFRLLERFAKSKQAGGRIVPVRAAAGDQNGTAELWRNLSHHADHRIITARFRGSGSAATSVSVPILKIDTFVEQQGPRFPVCFIKVDVQGYEFPVCIGMQRTLETNPGAALALEYAPEGMRSLGFQPESLLNWLAERNYHAYQVAKDGSLRPAACERLDTPYADLLFTRDAVAGS